MPVAAVDADGELASLFDLQADLIQGAISGDQDLASLLVREGLSYDSLVYETSHEKKWDGCSSLKLSDFGAIVEDVPIVSFFTGCGGMDLGFEKVGFKHVAAFEHNEVFCRTLRKNRSSWKVFGPPYHKGDVSDFEDVVNCLEPLVNRPFEGVFVGGPPCQPFSIAANQRFSKSGKDFKRVGFAHKKNGSLLHDYVRFIVEFQPRVFVIENVPGLRDIDGGEQLMVAVRMLEEAGYFVQDPEVLDAADYGVPQYRQRLFVAGSRIGENFCFPDKVDHVGSASVLASLPDDLPNHDTRNHKAASIERYIQLGYGQRDQLGSKPNQRLDPVALC